MIHFLEISFFIKQLQHAVNQALAAKGYRRNPQGGADFLIAYYVGLEDKVNMTTAMAMDMVPGEVDRSGIITIGSRIGAETLKCIDTPNLN